MRDDQFHLAFEVDGADGVRGQQVASLVDGVAADGAFAVGDRQTHEGPALVEGLAKSMQSRLCSMCSGRSLPSVPGRS